MKLKLFLYQIAVLLPMTGILLLSSCATNPSEKVKKMMGKYYMMQLRVPKDWTLVNKEYVKPEDLIDPKKPTSNFYVLHYFSADCDKCVKQLMVARQFIHENKKKIPNLKFVFVAGAINDYFIKETIQKLKFEFPMYYDKNYLTFDVSNGIPINNEPLYGTMLINRQNRLVLFGSLFDNEKAEKLYRDIVNFSK